MTLSPLGDAAVAIVLGDRVDAGIARRAQAVAAAILRHPPAGVTEAVAAFAGVAVFYDRIRSGPFATLCAELEKRAAAAADDTSAGTSRQIELPVCYGGEYGPDLDDVARQRGLSAAEVIALHTRAEYLVHAIGFAPGFPYLGGLPPQLATPRRSTPRTTVPAGSVGIGGAQTGIYPFATPGGWNLIGRTPRALFDLTRPEPALLRAGDTVRFRAASPEECHLLSDMFEKSGIRKARAECHLISDEMAGVATDGIEVVKAGMLTTVQDLGRGGYRAQGVGTGGAADAMALRLANLVVGNAETAAGLEFTLTGPELRFRRDALVALGGADFGAERWRPRRIRAGETLALGAARRGARGYLAVAGGIAVPAVLGSRSVHLRAGFGGGAGRALQAGDVLPVAPAERRFAEHWHIDERIAPAYTAHPTVRVVAGAQAAEFPAEWAAREFAVSARSDRMGVRLSGPPLERRGAEDLVSAPVVPGTIQVPPDGQPIVLLADAQTVGGYPQLGHVITVDLPLVAQLRPGDTVRFAPVSIEEAHARLLARERALGLLREGLAQKMR